MTAWRALVAVQVAALLVLGGVSVVRFHVWAAIDESAHYAYVASVAHHGKLPRPDDLVSPQTQAISDHTWPAPSPTDPRDAGLPGRNYEAFQPPLYYVAAVPAYAVVGDALAKVKALRVFDLLLLLAAALLLLALARRELPEAPPAALAGGLLVLLWPGVMLRGITVSNQALEIVTATGLILALVAAERGSRRAVLWAGVLLGACLLTKLTLVYLAVPFAIVLARRLREAPRLVLGSVAAAGAVVAPWLIYNLVAFGHLTQNSAARRVQQPVVNPSHHDYGVGDLLDRLPRLLKAALPQEWWGQLDVTWVQVAALLVLAALVVAAVLLAREAPGAARHAAAAVLAGIALMCATMVFDDWPIVLPRYVYAVLPALAVGVAAAAHRRFGDRAVQAFVAVQLLLVAALWVDGFGAFYFTDFGHKLGI